MSEGIVTKRTTFPVILLLSSAIIAVTFFTVNRTKPKSPKSSTNITNNKPKTVSRLAKRAQLVSISLTAMTSFGLLARSFLRIIDLIFLLNEDLDKGHRTRSVYSGRIASTSLPLQPGSNDRKERFLLSTVQYQAGKKQDYLKEINWIKESAHRKNFKLFSITNNSIHQLYAVPQDLYLTEDNTLLNLKEKYLERSAQDWPVKEFVVGSEKENKPKKQSLSLSKLVWSGILSALGFSSGINFEYCEKGIEAGAYVFCYGMGKRVLSNGKPTEVVNVEYITTSVDLMKRYLKEKIVKNVFLYVGLLGVFAVSGYYVWKSYEEGVIKSLQEESEVENLEQNNESNVSKRDYIANHYALYKKTKVVTATKCKCEKNFKNIVNFPCCHVDLCLSCFVDKTKRVCETCNSNVLDFYVLEYAS